MSVGLNVWSQTASANSTSDTNINWAEGMAPSQVNDSARALMASMAKWRDDNNGTIVTSGSTTAYTVVTSQVEGALTAGYTVQFQMHATNDSSATLAVDSLAAKPLQVFVGSNLLGGELTIGNIYYATYSTTGTGQWIVHDSGNQTNNIAANAITYAKIQNPGASVLLGNSSTSTSTLVREITLGTNLSFSGTVLNAGNNTPVVTTITSTATTTWQSTTQNGNFPLYLKVRMVAGGGGGGAQITNNGSTGSDTTFNNWGATGGGKGLLGSASGAVGGAGGSGGATGTGTLITRVSGATGQGGHDVGGVSFNPPGGAGGSSIFGGAGASVGTNAGGAAQANTGSGGAGGGGNGNASGSGGGAGEFVEFFVTSPSTSYTLQVGPGGAGASAGGAAGGNGAAGRIEVIAYWQ